MNLAEAVAFLIVRTGATEWRPLRTDRRQVNKDKYVQYINEINDFVSKNIINTAIKFWENIKLK